MYCMCQARRPVHSVGTSFFILLQAAGRLQAFTLIRTGGGSAAGHINGFGTPTELVKKNADLREKLRIERSKTAQLDLSMEQVSYCGPLLGSALTHEPAAFLHMRLSVLHPDCRCTSRDDTDRGVCTLASTS